MDNSINRLASLFALFKEGRATGKEKMELLELVQRPELEEQVKDLIGQEIIRMDSGALTYNKEQDQVKADEILQKIMGATEVPVIEMHPKKRWWKYAAAVIVFLLATSGYFMFFNKTGKPDEIVKTIEPIDVKAPETNRAMITLTNGQRVYLDSVVNGKLVQQNGVEMVKLADGKIVYKGSATEVVYNTLSNPKGSRVIDMTLADGSQVWLNAGSSITYPVAFVGKERKVSVNGEAYFEVAHNTAMPFKVSKNEMEVVVLGTHFNVNAYDDEADIKVTLLEGSVAVSTLQRVGDDKSVVTLKPGQQTILFGNGQLSTATTVNTDETIAWKDGLFHFESADIRTILRQFARWYDVEVIYEGLVKDRKFFVIVKRSNTLKNVLEMLKDNDILFRIEGKKLIVKSG